MKGEHVEWPINVTVQAVASRDDHDRPFILVGADEEGRTLRFIAAPKSKPVIGDVVPVFGHTIIAWIGGPIGPWRGEER